MSRGAGASAATHGYPARVPLYLIHTTNSPNPRPARVSSRFDFIEGLFLGDLIEAQKQGPFVVLDLLKRRADAKSKT
jgi:hypothetical protein